jgi:hypothetical protein
MIMAKMNFEQWAAGQPKPPVRESLPEMPIEDSVTRWSREAAQREKMRADAKAELREIEARETQTARRHELALAKANGSGGINFVEILGVISDSFEGLVKRVERLEAMFEEPDTEVLTLPGHLQPRHGPATGWPDNAQVHYSPPLLYKGTKPKTLAAPSRIVELSAAVEKRLATLERELAEQTKLSRDIEILRQQYAALQSTAQLTRDRLNDLKADLEGLRSVKPASQDTPVVHYHVDGR